MRNGQRPSKHVRRVHTKSGRKATVVNHNVRKPVRQLSFSGLQKRGIRLRPRGDFDGDGVPNKYDCKPLDKNKQDDPYYTAKVRGEIHDLWEQIRLEESEERGEFVGYNEVEDKLRDRVIEKYGGYIWDKFLLDV